MFCYFSWSSVMSSGPVLRGKYNFDSDKKGKKWILFNDLHNYKLDTYLDPMPAFCVFKNSPFVILDLTDSGNGSSSPLSTYLSSPARITISNFAKGRFHIGRRYLTTSAKGFTFPVSPWRIAKYLLLKFSWANLRNESAIIWNQTRDKMLIRNSLFTSFFITVE